MGWKTPGLTNGSVDCIYTVGELFVIFGGNRRTITQLPAVLQQQQPYTEKKEKKIFLKYKEIPNGGVAKSYMRKGFLIYEEMRKYLTIYEEAVSHLICDFATAPF